MNKNQDLIITPGSMAEDSVVAQHFYQLWLDNNVTPDSMNDDWLEVTLNFIAKARQYGYIWNVFVEPAYRRQGIGTKLTKTAIEHLRSLNCSHAILHASPHGKPVYENLGFVPKNEMILDIK